MRVLERGEGDMLRHAMGAHQVDCPLGQVRCVPFELDMELGSSVIARQHLSKRGNARPREGFSKPGTGVKYLEFCKCPACHWTSPTRRPIDGVVMDDNEVIVTGQVHVELQMVGSHLERQVKGRYGVLWGVGRCPPMRNDQETMRG
jgi:hypothetical protein